MDLYKKGLLGGDIMPEDKNPHLNNDYEMNLIYFTLPMALNYQRNSYKLWEAALSSYNDEYIKDIFDLNKVVSMDNSLLKQKLLKYKLALQPNKHTEIWKKLCCTFFERFNGKISNFLTEFDYDIEQIKTFIQKNKKMFPYLSGKKICNYWLYVLEQYVSIKFKNRKFINVAPDTHIIQSSLKLGLISKEEFQSNNVADIVIERWQELLIDEDIEPIDVHTPLWLWSRGGFQIDVQ